MFSCRFFFCTCYENHTFSHVFRAAGLRFRACFKAVCSSLSPARSSKTCQKQRVLSHSPSGLTTAAPRVLSQGVCQAVACKDLPCRRLTASKTFPGGVWEALRRLRGGSWRLQDGSAEGFGGFQEAFFRSSFLRAFSSRFFVRFWVPCWDPKTIKNRHT